MSLVYPAAIHTRFEHCLGVYRLALLYLKQLAHDERFAKAVGPEDAELLIAAALLHDLGHWPFCHPIEDIRLPSVPSHELFANSFLLEGEIADVLRHDWGINPRDVVALLSEKPRTPAAKILTSMLSGPIDIDKMDYLYRDSLHAGVPYGRHFDQQRLLGSLCLNQAGRRAGHHRQGPHGRRTDGFRPLRDVQRGLLASRRPRGDGHAPAGVLPAARDARSRRPVSHDRARDDRRACSAQPAAARRASCSTACSAPRGSFTSGWPNTVFSNSPNSISRLARRPYPWLAACAERFASIVSASLGRVIAPHEILFDSPPVALEVQFNVEIFFPKENRYRPLGEVSPVVRTLATEQFDDYVKRVRIFAHPRIVGELRRLANLPELLDQAITETEMIRCGRPVALSWAANQAGQRNFRMARRQYPDRPSVRPLRDIRAEGLDRPVLGPTIVQKLPNH